VTGHATGTGLSLLTVLLALGYEWRSLHVAGWSRWRGGAFMTGAAVLVAGLAVPAHDFTGHALQHLLVAMVAPLGLVLGAPVTLLLRTLPVSTARRLTGLLRSRPARLVAHPGTALVLTTGGLAVLYLTPLYARMLAEPALHQAVTIHFVLSGCLFAWVVAGADPAPHRPSVRTRLVLLGVAIAVHAGLSQLLYAGVSGQVPATAADRQAGATLMYYGGDLAELLLAFAVLQSRRGSGPRGTPAGPAVPRSGEDPGHGRPGFRRPADGAAAPAGRAGSTLVRSGVRGRYRLRRPGQLRHQLHRRRHVRLPAGLGDRGGEPDGDADPVALGQAGPGHRAGPGRAVP
jgi:putative membrane protein